MFIADHNFIDISAMGCKKAIRKLPSGPKVNLFAYSKNKKSGFVIGLMILEFNYDAISL